MNQEKAVLLFMEQRGSITQKEASDPQVVASLAAVIHKLRDSGHDLHSEIITVKNRFGEDCRVARYSIVKKGQQRLF